MEGKENNIIKLCSFYISDWHLVTMLLPYINKKINEEIEIATILEKDLDENISKLVEKLNLKNKEKILNLNWNQFGEKGKIIYNHNNKEKILIINGSKDFIENKNKRIEKYFQTHKLNCTIKIINCYEVAEFNGNITEILDKHDMILNTSGERKIVEVFTEYIKDEKIKKAI